MAHPFAGTSLEGFHPFTGAGGADDGEEPGGWGAGHWAAVIAAGSFLVLGLLLARGGKLSAGLVQALGLVLVVGLAEAPVHFIARAYAERNPESPFLGGVAIDF